VPEWAEELARFAGLVVAGAVASWLLRRLVRRGERRMRGTLPRDSPAGKRARTLASVLTALGVVVIWLVVAITALEVAGVPVGPLLAAAGIGGVALGFGAQNLVRDLVAGTFILSENQYDIGDHVVVAGVEGTVEAITLRSTVVRSVDGTRHVVSNGEIRVSSNATRVYSRYVMVVPVPYEADVDRALAVLRATGEELAADPTWAPDVAAPPTVMGVDAFTESRVELKLMVETVPGRQWAVGRELRRRIRLALAAAGVPMVPPPAGGAGPPAG